MEKLKAMVPHKLKVMVAATRTDDDILSSSSSLLDFFLSSQDFHLMVRDLVDPERFVSGKKNKDAALHSKQLGNLCFSDARFSDALSHFSHALRLAPFDALDRDRNLVSVLYFNRALVLYKLGLKTECLRDCNRALQISPGYAKAWYWRGKANADLENFEDAISDFSVANLMETSLGAKKQINSEMKTTDQSKRTSSSSGHHQGNVFRISDDPQEAKVKCVMMPPKGRGMASVDDIPPSSLIHVEEPYAAVILKSFRERYCHYCFNELPVDMVPCSSCTIPLYCSGPCQLKAGGHGLNNYMRDVERLVEVPAKEKNYIEKITSEKVNEQILKVFPEHRHECLDVNWPAILPQDVVLAGRMIVKSLQQRSDSMDKSDLTKALDLFYNFAELAMEIKLEFHIYSIVLLFCLKHSHSLKLPVNANSVSQIIILMCQIRFNSMAIVRMKSVEPSGLQDHYKKFLSNGGASASMIEQVSVGQAIYATGSFFNHSCHPNSHTYFLSRTLFVRTTELVEADYPVELSYGPQVGQWKCGDRLNFLKEKYSFQCQCRGCSLVNLSDLLLSSFHCADAHCSGIVLDTSDIRFEKGKFMGSTNAADLSSLKPYLQVEKLRNLCTNRDHNSPEKSCRSLHANLGFCLKCGSSCDLESSHVALRNAWRSIKRLQDAIDRKELSSCLLFDALESLNHLRVIVHTYNKCIAEAEDTIAQAFCFAGDLQSAVGHCKSSIQILEKHYSPNHIAIGYELVKLLSIQMSLGDSGTWETMNRLDVVFEHHYGPHAEIVFPYLRSLKREARKLVHSEDS